MNDPDFDPYLPPRAPVGRSRQETSGTVALDGNPWLTIWTSPRATIRGIVESDPTHHVILLSILYGISATMGNAIEEIDNDLLSMPILWGIFLIGGPLGGLLSLYLFGAIVRWTGGWLGGEATYQEVRAAYAWGWVPYVFNLIFLTCLTIVFGQLLYLADVPEGSPGIDLARIVAKTLTFVASLWSLILVVKCVAEVNRFSGWRAIGAFVLAGLVFLGICLVLVLGMVAFLAILKSST